MNIYLYKIYNRKIIKKYNYIIFLYYIKYNKKI